MPGPGARFLFGGSSPLSLLGMHSCHPPEALVSFLCVWAGHAACHSRVANLAALAEFFIFPMQRKISYKSSRHKSYARRGPYHVPQSLVAGGLSFFRLGLPRDLVVITIDYERYARGILGSRPKNVNSMFAVNCFYRRPSVIPTKFLRLQKLKMFQNQ